MNINEIKDPKFLKDLNYDQLNDLCKDIREEIIRVTSINGGHLSSNLGVVELTLALHRHFDFAKDKLFLDVGHQCYTHKIVTGRKLDNLRKKDGISGFPKISESIYDHFEGGHSSNSLSNALGYAVARDLKKEKYEIVCVIGDASISNGLAFEALNDNRIQDHKMIIILNDNGMSISKNVGNVSKIFSRISTSGLYNKSKLAYKRISAKSKFGKKMYEAAFTFKNAIKRFLVRDNYFSQFGLNYIGVIDGHNIKKVEKALKRAKNSVKSTVIHVKTTKGLGYKEAEVDRIGEYHGIAPSQVKDIKPNMYWSATYSELFEELFKKDDKMVLISPATLHGSCFESLKDEFDNRVFDVGIAEEHAISFAAGLSLNGFKPYVSIYSTFLQRAIDEVSHDVARMKIPTTLLIDRCGLSDGDGNTHQGIFDEGFLMNVPNCTLCMASTIEEAKRLLELSANTDHLFAIRYPKGTVYSNPSAKSFDEGDWIDVISNNNRKVIISFGPVINEFKEKIADLDLKYDLINAIFQNTRKLDVFRAIKDKYDEIVIFNQYGTENGFNYFVINELNKVGYEGKIRSFALALEFGSSQSTKDGLIEQKMDVDSFLKGL